MLRSLLFLLLFLSQKLEKVCTRSIRDGRESSSCSDPGKEAAASPLRIRAAAVSPLSGRWRAAGEIQREVSLGGPPWILQGSRRGAQLSLCPAKPPLPPPPGKEKGKTEPLNQPYPSPCSWRSESRKYRSVIHWTGKREEAAKNA